MRKHSRSQRSALATVLLLLLLLAMGVIPASAQDCRPGRPGSFVSPDTLQPGAIVYQNPLRASIPGDGVVESCADPSIIHGQTANDPYWYVFCTTDPLNGADKDAQGNFNFHLIPILRSLDLVNWTYMGDAFASRPSWAASDAGLWAPDIHYFNGQYYLYYTASWTSLPGGGSAIWRRDRGQPAGPWVDSGSPVVEPHAPPCCAERQALGVRSGVGHGRLRSDLDILRQLLRGHLGPQAVGRRAAFGPGLAGPDHELQQVRGRLRRQASGLLLPVRLGHRLLPRPPDRLQRLRRDGRRTWPVRMWTAKAWRCWTRPTMVGSAGLLF